MYIIFEKIQKLIEAHNQAFLDYNILQNGLQEEISNERMTLTVAGENRDAFKLDTNAKLARLASDASATLANFIENQTNKARDLTTTSVTADEVAEINMLSMMEDVTREELENYQKKYEGKPLLLKRLGEVARKHEAPLLFTDEQLQKMDPMKVVRETETELTDIIRRHGHIASYPTSTMTEADDFSRDLATKVYKNTLEKYKAKAL